MRSSSARPFRFAVLVVAASLLASHARAQPKTPRTAPQTPQGFGVERLYASAPGGGWFVMDDLDMHGGLGGTVALTTGYATKPLHVAGSRGELSVVSDEAFVDFGFAVTYDRFRLYLNLDAPITVDGQSGTASGFTYSAPLVGPGATPDTLSDARIGLDARLFGGPTSPLRLGVCAQLFIPNGNRTTYGTDGTYQGSNYLTDGTYRGMFRALVAGDLGPFTYAGHLGVHLRPLADSVTPNSPKGSELLFGVAAGGKLSVTPGGGAALVVGPEVFGETAFHGFLGAATTGVEGLLSARVEGTGDDGPQLRVKLGAGGGLDPQFGAPEWRFVFGVELFDHRERPPPTWPSPP